MSEEILAEYQSNQHEINLLFAKTFQTETGQKLLKYLEDNTIHKMCADPQIKENAVYWAFFREGQNSLVREIKDRIKKAQNPK